MIGRSRPCANGSFVPMHLLVDAIVPAPCALGNLPRPFGAASPASGAMWNAGGHLRRRPLEDELLKLPGRAVQPVDVALRLVERKP